MSMLSRTVAIGALIGASACHQAPPPESVLPPAAQRHYRISENGPANVAADGNAITMRRTESFVTVGERDSAGIAIWELIVDSTSSMIVPRHGRDPRVRAMQLGPVMIAVPTSYRAYVQGGQVIRTQADGKTTGDSFAIDNPTWSLLAQLPPFASLPRSGLPLRGGESRIDSSVSQKRLASGLWYDTLVVNWRRRGPGVIDGTLTHQSRFVETPSRRVEREGSVHIVLAENGSIIEARIEERGVTHSVWGRIVDADAHVAVATLLSGS